MIQSNTTNTFNDGLIMDLNPLVTPENVLTNCLNGTIRTYNGNENVLQNDMGNGRVETAFLPEGYIPLGTAELGGIIYIVSYNPQKKTCQIGSFPSPERNISSDEINNSSVISIDNNSFKATEDGATIYYLKNSFGEDLVLNPGDKFIVYSSNITANFDKLNQLGSDVSETVRLTLGTITSDGKLVRFDQDDLKKFKINSKNYYIKENNSEKLSESDIDEYRETVSQPYNIFTSKVSGTLVLITELIQFDTFSISLSHKFVEEQYSPVIETIFTGENKFIPECLKVELTLPDNQTDTYYIEFNLRSDKNTKSKTEWTISNLELFSDEFKIKLNDYINKLNPDYFKNEPRPECLLHYTITPCMNWGTVEQLKVSGNIQLHRIGTGYIDLNQWRYYNTNTKCNLVWGLESYLEEGKEITGIEIILTRLIEDSGNITTENNIYTVGNKKSYLSIQDIIPFDQNYYKLNKPLQANTLYLATFNIKSDYITPQEIDDGKQTTSIQRWLFTNQMYNEQYSSTFDYKNLSLFDVDLATTIEVTKNIEENSVKTSQYIGHIRNADSAYTAEDTISAIKTNKEYSINGSVKVALEQDYNLFKVNVQNDYCDISLNNDSTIEVTNKIKCIGEKSFLVDKYLDNLLYTNYNGNNIELNNSKKFYSDTNNKLVDQSEYWGNGVYTGSIISTTFDNNVYSFSNISIKIETIAKAYSTLREQICKSDGQYIPLAYNNETYEQYNLKYNSGTKSFVPIHFGTYGSHEKSGKKGHNYISILDAPGGNSVSDAGPYRNNINFKWTEDQDILNKMQEQGWKGTIMFTILRGNDGDNTDWHIPNNYVKQTPYNGNKGTTFFGRDMLNANNKSYSPVLVTMKSNTDDFYYPINCCVWESYSGTQYSNLIARGSNAGRNIKMYNHIASILNNLYHKDIITKTVNYNVPENIFYGDEYNYTVNVPLHIVLNKSNTSKQLQIKINNSTYKSSEDILGLFNITNNDLRNSLSNENIKDNITNPIITISFTDYTSGIILRDIFVSSKEPSLGLAILDCSGNVLKYTTEDFKENELLCFNSDQELVRASQFEPTEREFELSEGKLIIKNTNRKLFQTSHNQYNISKNFTLDNNYNLVLNNPPKSEVTMRIHIYHDPGQSTGFQKRGLSPDYEFLKT